VILYFAACTSIENYTIDKSATPVVTKGEWKVKFFQDANNDKTGDFAGYTFTFNMTGNLKASKNGVDVNGNWVEDEISKKISINLGDASPLMNSLKGNWSIEEISNAKLCLQHQDQDNPGRLNFTSL
jgi:hypothetical protein